MHHLANSQQSSAQGAEVDCVDSSSHYNLLRHTQQVKMGRQENKRKKYYRSAGKKISRVQRSLDHGMRGFLLTCANNKERDCVREAYRMLNTYADKIYSPEKIGSDSENDEDDPDVALQQEVDAIKSTSTSERRFQAVDTKCKNVVFIKTLLEHPEELLEAIMRDVSENKIFSSTQICRVMPVVATCKANVKTMTETAEKVLEPFFMAKSCTFSIHVKIRNNSSLTRNDILPLMGHVIKSMNPGNSVNLDKPDYVVSFDVLTNITCISVMQDFDKRCKYNLQEMQCRVNMEELKKNEETGKDTGKDCDLEEKTKELTDSENLNTQENNNENSLADSCPTKPASPTLQEDKGNDT